MNSRSLKYTTISRNAYFSAQIIQSRYQKAPVSKPPSFHILPRSFLDHLPSAAFLVSVSSFFLFDQSGSSQTRAATTANWYVFSLVAFLPSLSAPQLQLMFLKSCRTGSVAIEPMQGPFFDKLQYCKEAKSSVVGAKSLDGCK
jgi:hypothetical protein